MFQGQDPMIFLYSQFFPSAKTPENRLKFHFDPSNMPWLNLYLFAHIFIFLYNSQMVLFDYTKICSLQFVLFRSVDNSEFEIPIFICTLAFPSVPCPLHIFEPQYKLMIRRCIESGSKQFGMCVLSEDSSFPTIGTILKIKEVAYLQDGRSLINTMGTRRFKLLSHDMKDGYNVAKVKWLVDEVEDDEEEVKEIKRLHENGFKMLKFWFNCLTSQQQECIIDAIGSMPEKEELDSRKNDQPSWLWWALAALPLQDKPKIIILAMTSVVERLRSISRFLMLMIKMQQRNTKKE